MPRLIDNPASSTRATAGETSRPAPSRRRREGAARSAAPELSGASAQLMALHAAVSTEPAPSAPTSRLVQFQAALTAIMATWAPLERTIEAAIVALAASLDDCAPAFFRLRDARLHCTCASRMQPGLVRAITGLTIEQSGDDYAGYAPFWSFEPASFDIATAEAWRVLRPVFLLDGHTGCWSWPVFSPSGEALGLLAVFCTEARAPREDERAMLDCACRILALLLEQRLLTEDLRYEAEHDTVTHALNSTAFHKVLDRALASAGRRDKCAALVCLDLDRMSVVNDLLGRAVGDVLLRQLAARLGEMLSAGDVLARTGANEFAILLHECTEEQALQLGLRAADRIRQPFPVRGSEIRAHASIGVACYPAHATDARALLQAAQATVRRIKSSGRNRVELCDPRTDRVDVNRVRLEGALRQAVSNGELLLYYQPQYRLSDLSLHSVEALMRWRSTELGLISPGMFIPLAEETGEIVALGSWALEESCRQAKCWDATPGRPQRISVNVSPVQLARPELVTHLRDALRHSGVNPDKIQLELTESTFLGDLELTRRRLCALRDEGVHLALDDFGTGYSALAVLRELPFDIIKIDRSFLIGVDSETAATRTCSRNLLARIIGMGHDLGKEIVVEGVETRSQLEVLRQMECDIVQGFLLGRPKPSHVWDLRPLRDAPARLRSPR